jgi:transposase
VTRSAELSEVAWAPIEPLMPQAGGRSRPWRDHRQVVEAIVFRYRTGTAMRGARPLREEIVRPQRTRKGKESSHSPSTLSIERTGGLAARPGSCRRIAEPTEVGRAKCVCCYRRMGRAGRRTDGGTRGAVAGTRRGGAGVCAARLRGAAGPCRRAAGAGRPALARAGDVGASDAADGGGPAPARDGVHPAQVDTDAATAEGCDAPVLRGVMPEGVWR